MLRVFNIFTEALKTNSQNERMSMHQKNDSRLHNNRINSDWQFRYAPLPAGYAERYA
jgi:hypothetical protein